jgi:hypothetical protein
MALIERHPEVEDYILEMPLREIIARGGVADLIETGHVVIVADHRLDFDFPALQALRRASALVEDKELQRRLKKLEAPQFFDGPPPKRLRRPAFRDPLRQALFETVCGGDRAVFNRAAKALRKAHDDALRIFEAAFPEYEAYRFVPSVRLTQTLFENLHWDDHSIDDDFHQARVFANLDTRPRIWHLSHRFPVMMRAIYQEHDLARFAGRDPNKMLFYIHSEILGGLHNKWRDSLPRHRIAFEPGEIWLGESRLVSHQIYYGEAALVYMWFVRVSSMANPDNRFNLQIERLHAEMRHKEERAN